jgi:hypothetical protein
MDIKEGQIWRKCGPHDWLKIIQILDPEYPGHDGGKHGAMCRYYPPQLAGMQCRGGKTFFVADAQAPDGTITSWEDQITHNRLPLTDFNRGTPI